MDQKSLNPTTADWRKIIRLNTRRTYFVIFSFVVIYLGLGFFVDLYLAGNKYPNVNLSQLLNALIHFDIFPTATVVLGALAVIAVWITFAWHDTLMLLGTDYHEITPESARSTQELQLYNVVEEMKISAGLKFMPKVYVIDADYMNAFATGYSEKSAMVTITRGLLTKLNRAELQAVMAHELSHIRHLDIKLTLMAAILANITLIVIDILFRGALYGDASRNRDGKNNNGRLFFIIMILRILLPIVTLLLIFYLSRTREYMADAGCVELMRDNQPLANALLKIHNDHVDNKERYAADYKNTPHESIRREAYIYDPKQAGISNMQSISDLFSTHPSINKRLAALGFKKK
ncbi:MAG: zinc metalloprotease HtpX [Gammaproteobacteria bacterium]|nr:zinc metalloprotease HtpX [Gammaproteobacteria bacterium]